ncbi:MAG: hypothetical protein ABSE49_28675 [Polyangiaceae bacterium]
MAAAIALSMAPLGLACGLTADFSGLQGGTRDAGLIDVASPLLDGGDAGAHEAGDAAGEAAGEAAAADAGFCASLTTPYNLCADFDEGLPVGAGWSGGTDVSQGESVSVDLTYFSPPGSFLSLINGNSSAESARLQEDLPIDAAHVHIEFQMLLPAYSGGNFELCTLHEPVADGLTYGVFYKYQDGNLLVFARALADDGGEVDYVGQIGPPPSDWLLVDIDTDVSESANIVVKHDGVEVLNATGVDTSTLTRASMFVELGYYSDDQDATLAHFDNVVMTWNN